VFWGLGSVPFLFRVQQVTGGGRAGGEDKGNKMMSIKGASNSRTRPFSRHGLAFPRKRQTKWPRLPARAVTTAPPLRQASRIWILETPITK
jgi:hypothetical protein